VLDDAIARHAEHAERLLADLVAADSTLGREQAALEVFAAELEDLGLEVTRPEFRPETLTDPRAGVSPAYAVSDLSQDQQDRSRYQVLGSTPGTGGYHLLLNGHIDVVPVVAGTALWTDPPFTPTVRGRRLYGRGSGDMKGGFALGCLAIRAALEVRPDLFERRRLGFLAVVEEECSGNGALATCLDGVLAEEVLLLEPTDLGILLGGVGVLWLDIEVTGHAGHADVAHLVQNPVDLGMRVVERLRGWCRDLSLKESDPHLAEVESPYNLNLGGVDAGDWTSTVPAPAPLRVRVGFPRGWSAEEAEARVRAEIEDLVASDPAFAGPPVVRSSGLRARGYYQDPDVPLVRDLAAAHRDAHGVEPRLFSLGSTTDARTYVNDFGIPAACYGTRSHNIHGVDESVDLDSLVEGARTVGRFLLARFGADGDGAEAGGTP
jgi:acetylornithine deacetylase